MKISCPVSFFRPPSRYFHHSPHPKDLFQEPRRLYACSREHAFFHPPWRFQAPGEHKRIRKRPLQPARRPSAPAEIPAVPPAFVPVPLLSPKAIHSPYPSRKAYAFFRSSSPSISAKDKIARPTSCRRQPYWLRSKSRMADTSFPEKSMLSGVKSSCPIPVSMRSKKSAESVSRILRSRSSARMNSGKIFGEFSFSDLFPYHPFSARLSQCPENLSRQSLHLSFLVQKREEIFLAFVYTDHRR